MVCRLRRCRRRCGTHHSRKTCRHWATAQATGTGPAVWATVVNNENRTHQHIPTSNNTQQSPRLFPYHFVGGFLVVVQRMLRVDHFHHHRTRASVVVAWVAVVVTPSTAEGFGESTCGRDERERKERKEKAKESKRKREKARDVSIT